MIAVVTSVYLWDRIEPCVSVIVACLPTYGPLIRDNALLARFTKWTSSFFTAFSRVFSTPSRPSKLDGSTDIYYTEALRSKPQEFCGWERSDEDAKSSTRVFTDNIELPNSSPKGVHVSNTIALEYSGR